MKLSNAENKLGRALFFIGIIFLIISVYLALSYNTFYFDEIFSITAIKLPWNRFVSLMFRDVHPPLHYLILKAFVGFFALFGVEDMIAARLSSIAAVCILIIVSYFKVKKEFGWLTFGIFTLCITSMPQFMNYAIDFRMYIWAMLFTTLCFIYFYSIVKSSNIKNWVIFTAMAICAAYTHYYAAISAAMIYLVFLVYIIRKNRSLITAYIASAAACVVAYVPWIIIIKYQVSRKVNFWIEPIGVKRVISYFYYIFSPSSQNIIGNEMVKPTVLGTVLIIAIFLLIVYFLKCKKDDFDITYAEMGILIAVLVPICGIIISFIKFPLLHYRYLFPPLGCLWLGVSILLTKIKDKKTIFIPMIALLLIVSVVGTVSFIDYDHEFYDRSTAYNQTLQNTFEDNALVITESESVFLHYRYLLYSHENTSTIQLDKYTTEELKELINNHDGPVYYLHESDLLDNELNLTDDEIVFEYQMNPYKIAMDLQTVYKIK